MMPASNTNDSSRPLARTTGVSPRTAHTAATSLQHARAQCSTTRPPTAGRRAHSRGQQHAQRREGHGSYGCGGVGAQVQLGHGRAVRAPGARQRAQRTLLARRLFVRGPDLFRPRTQYQSPPRAARVAGGGVRTSYCVQLKQCQQQLSPSTYCLAWPSSHSALHTDSGGCGSLHLN